MPVSILYQSFSVFIHNSIQLIHTLIIIKERGTYFSYAGQEATVRTGHETIDWFQVRKEVCQGCILSPCLFNLYAEYIM